MFTCSQQLGNLERSQFSTLRVLRYKGEFLEDEEQQVRRTKNGMKTVSVSMIAKIVAILMSEEFALRSICNERTFMPWIEFS